MPPLPCPLQSVLVALAGWMNQQPTRCHRLSPGREPRPAGTARAQTLAVHRRSAPSTGGESQDARTSRSEGLRYDCDAGHVAGVAPDIDRQEIRREYTSWPGTTARHGRDPSVDRAYGHG